MESPSSLVRRESPSRDRSVQSEACLRNMEHKLPIPPPGPGTQSALSLHKLRGLINIFDGLRALPSVLLVPR